MNCKSQRRPCARSLCLLFVVECAPFWSSISYLLSDYASTINAHNLGSIVVSHQLRAATLWADSDSRLSLHGFYWICLWVFHLSTIISLQGRILFVRRPILVWQSLASRRRRAQKLGRGCPLRHRRSSVYYHRLSCLVAQISEDQVSRSGHGFSTHEGPCPVSSNLRRHSAKARLQRSHILYKRLVSLKINNAQNRCTILSSR